MKWSDCFFNKAFSLKVPKADTPPTKSVQRLKNWLGKTLIIWSSLAPMRPNANSTKTVFVLCFCVLKKSYAP